MSKMLQFPVFFQYDDKEKKNKSVQTKGSISRKLYQKQVHAAVDKLYHAIAITQPSSKLITLKL